MSLTADVAEKYQSGLPFSHSSQDVTLLIPFTLSMSVFLMLISSAWIFIMSLIKTCAAETIPSEKSSESSASSAENFIEPPSENSFMF